MRSVKKSRFKAQSDAYRLLCLCPYVRSTAIKITPRKTPLISKKQKINADFFLKKLFSEFLRGWRIADEVYAMGVTDWM